LRISEYTLVKKNLYPFRCAILELLSLNFVWVTSDHVVALKILK